MELMKGLSQEVGLAESSSSLMPPAALECKLHHSCSNRRQGAWPFAQSYQTELWAVPGEGGSPLASPEKGAPMSRRHSPEKGQVGATGS